VAFPHAYATTFISKPESMSGKEVMIDTELGSLSPAESTLVFREDSLPTGPGTKKSWLVLQDVGFSIKQKNILTNINAVIPPGELIALMGPSGAGKTSLLNVISGRAKGDVHGDLKINGRKISKNLMKRSAKLVPQLDNLNPVLTARETLDYTAKLAIAGTSEEREAKVQQVIVDLSLSDCADVMIGDVDTKGLSGGQIKRVSIGCELLSDPSLLFLDEPTSGLDSKIAEDVVKLLRAIARGGRTVVCTIHQPSFQVFALFDRLIMLDKGMVAFDGPVNRVSDYLSALGSPCPEFVNPADHLMHLLSQPNPDSQCSSFGELFSKQKKFAAVAEEKSKLDMIKCDSYVESTSKVAGGKKQKESEYPITEFSQFFTLFRRECYSMIKDKKQLRVRVGQLTIIGLIVGSIFFQLGNAQSDVQVKLSVEFLILLFLGMSSIMGTAIAMPIGKAVMRREYGNGYYGMLPYFFSKLLVLLLFQIIYALYFGTFLYFMVGFYLSASAFFLFILTVVIVSCLAGTFGFVAGIIFPTIQATTAITPMLVLPLSIFAGLFITYDDIPVYWIWLYYISFFQYALQNMVILEFRDSTFDPCYTSLGEICPYGPCNPVNASDPLGCPGTMVFNQLNYDPDNLGRNFAILLGEWAAVASIGCFALYRLLKKN